MTARSYRLLGAIVLALGLVALEYALPVAFPYVVSIALLAAPAINWRAWYRLRAKLSASEILARLGEAPIVSLQTATNAALFLAIGSTVTASLGVFVALRALNLVDAIPREVFLLILSYPPLLATGPAFDWLATVGRLEREVEEVSKGAPS